MWPLGELLDSQGQVRMGQANVRRSIPEIEPLLEGDRDPLGVDVLTTHRLPLDETPARRTRRSGTRTTARSRSSSSPGDR
jgi:hypothetical protein